MKRPALVILVALTVSAIPAWSFETVKVYPPSATASAADPFTTVLPIRPDAANDPCRSLLKTSFEETGDSSSAMDRDRRSAGQAAALSLVFGVQFAVGPRELTISKHPTVGLQFSQSRNDTGSTKALAIAEYRHCRNEQALRAIDSWRWSR